VTQFQSSTGEYPVFLVEQSMFSPMYVFGSFAKDHMAKAGWVSFFFFFLFYLWGGATGLWNQGPILSRQSLHIWSMSQSPFFFSYFSDRASRFSLGLVLDNNPPPVWLRSLVHATITGFFGWDAVSLTFCPDWPQTAILLMSVQITDVRYYAQLHKGLFLSLIFHWTICLFYASTLLFVTIAL
jgi:hypothetical protein